MWHYKAKLNEKWIEALQYTFHTEAGQIEAQITKDSIQIKTDKDEISIPNIRFEEFADVKSFFSFIAGHIDISLSWGRVLVAELEIKWSREGLRNHKTKFYWGKVESFTDKTIDREIRKAVSDFGQETDWYIRQIDNQVVSFICGNAYSLEYLLSTIGEVISIPEDSIDEEERRECHRKAWYDCYF